MLCLEIQDCPEIRSLTLLSKQVTLAPQDFEAGCLNVLQSIEQVSEATE